MSTEFRDASGEWICTRWGSKKAGPPGNHRCCFDFGSPERFDRFNNESAFTLEVFGDDGTQTTLWKLLVEWTGTCFLPNPLITFGEFCGTVELGSGELLDRTGETW